MAIHTNVHLALRGDTCKQPLKLPVCYHSKIALYPYTLYIYSKNLTEYFIRLDKVHRKSTDLTKMSDCLSQVRERFMY